jgi:hypothetical protein
MGMRATLRRCLLTSSVLCLGLAVAPSSSQAGILLQDGSQQGNRSFTGGTVGTRFAVGSTDILVNALGFEDPGADGLQVSHQVGLWTSGGSLLASVTVPSGTGGTFNDGWRYVSITPTLLTAGMAYVLGGETTGSFDLFSDASGAGGNGVPDFSYGPLIGDVNPTNVFASTALTFPNQDGGGTDLRWAPANALAVAPAAVPEPSTFASAGIAGLIGLGVVWRRRKRAA